LKERASVSEYVGGELELFRDAVRWKAYWASRIRRYLGARVLEVGAGIGANAMLLATPAQRQWLCLEPDPRLTLKIEEALRAGLLPSSCAVQTGTIDDLSPDQRFDTILYIDVMEHIEADSREFATAAAMLADGGHLVVLAPAHQMLFAPFDAAIGHHRRYDRAGLRELGATSTLRLEKLFYLDSVGLAASAANRIFLRSEMPTRTQVMLWDRFMVPLSRVVDPLTAYRLGKTVIGIWRRS